MPQGYLDVQTLPARIKAGDRLHGAYRVSNLIETLCQHRIVIGRGAARNDHVINPVVVQVCHNSRRLHQLVWREMSGLYHRWSDMAFQAQGRDGALVKAWDDVKPRLREYTGEPAQVRALAETYLALGAQTEQSRVLAERHLGQALAQALVEYMHRR